MTEQQLVSVIIPFFNAERFLSEAIESVQAQTCTCWELILLDDGSSDRSSSIAQDYASASHGRIHYHRHDTHANHGVTASRNAGAKVSRGAFLAFLDADDVWLPSKLDHQLAVMNAHPDAGLVFGPSEYWYDWDPTRQLPHSNQIEPVAPGPKLYSPPELLLGTHPFGRYGAPSPVSFLLRRSAFERVGGFEGAFHPGAFQLYEDTAFLTKLYLEVPVFVTDICTDRYRCRADSIWHRLKDTDAEENERRFYFEWLRRYLRTYGVTDPKVWKAVRSAGWTHRLHMPSSASRMVRRIQNRLRH